MISQQTMIPGIGRGEVIRIDLLLDFIYPLMNAYMTIERPTISNR